MDMARIGDKPCLVITNTGADYCETDITTEWPDGKPSLSSMLQTASEETLPIWKVALVELTWEAAVTDELILGLDTLTFMDLGRYVLLLNQTEVSIWSPRVQPIPSPLVVASNHVIWVQCEGVIITTETFEGVVIT
jgi:hypothetical protein